MSTTSKRRKDTWQQFRKLPDEVQEQLIKELVQDFVDRGVLADVVEEVRTSVRSRPYYYRSVMFGTHGSTELLMKIGIHLARFY
jgi:hypothetical protein